MLFPTIDSLEEFKAKVAHLPEIRFNTVSNGYTVACYMISDNDTFSGESAPWARECRGITFDREGKIAARPFHKFFNVGERPDTQADIFDREDVVTVMDKRDGSMVHPLIVDGELVFKTKKSFESDVAIAATKFLRTQPHVEVLCRNAIDLDITPIFEYTGPTNRIVLAYEKTELRLLAARHNKTGKYLSRFQVSSMAEELAVALVDVYPIMSWDVAHVWDEIKSNLETLQGIEGYVIQFASGEMVKAKTAWYMELHHTVVFQTERSIAEMVINETVDDFKSYLSASGEGAVEALKKVNEIEEKVLSFIVGLEKSVDETYEANKELDRKTFAIKHQGQELFGLLMKRYVGQEPDFKGYFEKYMLKENFSLEQI